MAANPQLEELHREIETLPPDAINGLLRLVRSLRYGGVGKSPEQSVQLLDYAGRLKDSDLWNDTHPLTIQKAMRDEWA